MAEFVNFGMMKQARLFVFGTLTAANCNYWVADNKLPLKTVWSGCVTDIDTSVPFSGEARYLKFSTQTVEYSKCCTYQHFCSLK